MAKKTDNAGKMTLKEALTILEKKHGPGTVMKFAKGQEFVPVDVIPTGIYSIDKALGVGGIPRGRVVEIYGNEASGKTSLALHTIAEAQKQGLVAAYIDVEHAFDMAYASKLGVDVEKLLFSQPASAEEAFDIARTFAETGEIGLVVVDSVSALVTAAELESDVGKSQIGLLARFMSQSLRQLVAAFSKTNTTLLFINQIRMMVGVAYGNPETTSGGKALKYYASQRIEVKRYSVYKDKTGKPIGHIAKINIVKNKVAAPNQKCDVPVIFNVGFDKIADVFNYAINENVLYREGGTTIFFDGEKIGVGENAVQEKFTEDEEFRNKVIAKLEELRNATTKEADESTE